ncbi:T6SS amidase immunity protein Tai4 family protein [Sphingomonas bacterium]|uniref:T6SS amidase immunity protein Tai4 family protein n=1 Tax=Sphingomonas bacterium TaxID=1895847 RepID=UPI00157579B8|nr:T6SS amidase immunity protein Tai4 family protein [Sphingomonas bacterium]
MPILALLLAAGRVAVAHDDVRHRTYLQNAKDAALAGCIAEAYRTSPDASGDAVATAGGYMQNFTDFDIEHGGEKLSALITRTLTQSYLSIQGSSVRLDLMKCLDMYHGRELDALVHRYSAHPLHSYARDYPDG